MRPRAASVIVGFMAVVATAAAFPPLAVRAEGTRTLRALNCHPDGDRPLQGTGYPHQPPVQRGIDGRGVTAMRCTTCHQMANFDPGRVPGHPN